MKSYLRFLGRNKLYTAIEVVGLSIALAFLIVLGSILIDKSQVNDNIKDAEDIYALADVGEYPGIGQSGAVGTFLQQIPMVKEWCRFTPGRQVKMKTESGDSLMVAPMQVTSNFFDFFGIDLINGDPVQALTALSSYYSHLHTHDTAIRKVLGISRREIFWETIWGFIFPVLIGALIGVPLAYMYVSHWLQSYVIKISNSPGIYAVAILITLLATIAAVSLQTIRLMRTNPAEALKKE